MLHDFTLAIKHLRRSPLFVVVAVVTLGLGIGLSTTMLTMLDTILHPYVPYRDAHRLYSVAAYGDGANRKITGYEKYLALTENAASFTGIAGRNFRNLVLAEAYGNAAQVQLMRVTGNYFPLLDMKPEMGRFFLDGPSTVDDGKAVVSYGFWQQVLAARPFQQGLNVTIDGRDYTVIGVMQPEASTRSDIVVVRLPGLAGIRAEERLYLEPIVRLKDGVTEGGAYAELGVLATRLKAAYGEGRQKFHFRLYSMKPETRAITNFQLAMVGSALAVLVIACANLANLMLARGLNRRKEMALRLALGASRRDLIRQLMVESSVVGILGGIAGTLVSVWGVGLVRMHLPASGRWIGFLAPHLDWRVYAFAIVVTALATILFGLLPAITASDISVSEPLKEGAGTLTGRTKHRYSALVVSEVGICLVVLMAAGLMLRQLDQANAYVAESGEGRGVIQGRVRLFPEKLRRGSSVDQEFANIRDRYRQVSGVLDAAVWANHRGAGGAIVSDFEGDTVPRFVIGGGYLAVTPDYLRVTGRRVIAGRGFEVGDRFTSVAIVDEWMADRMWPGISPLGRMIKLGGAQSTAPWVRVVGVIRSPRAQRPTYVRPVGELLVMASNEDATSRGFLVRTNANSAVVATALRRVLADMYPIGAWEGGYFYDIERMNREALRPFSFITSLFSWLGGLSLILTGVGMYGVLAYSVAQRMREFGIRIALGSDTRSVFKLVLHDAAVMILAGVAIGAWFAMWAGNLMVNEDSSMILQTDWIALVAGEFFLLLVCFGACMTPAIRASKANPLDIIRAI